MRMWGGDLNIKTECNPLRVSGFGAVGCSKIGLLVGAGSEQFGAGPIGTKRSFRNISLRSRRGTFAGAAFSQGQLQVSSQAQRFRMQGQVQTSMDR